MLHPWLEIDAVRAAVEQHSSVAGLDLVAAGTTMSETDITDTAVAQPLLVSAALASSLLLPPLPSSTVVAGHSVGEFAAATLAGVLPPATAMQLIAVRGRAMSAASGATRGAMLALLGGDPVVVADAITAAGATVATVNAPGQVVAAGDRASIDRLSSAPPEGARLRPLAVAGAFHTELMAPAQQALADATRSLSPGDPQHLLLSNADGQVVDDGAEVLRRLVAQVCRPVRWDRCMSTMAALGVTATLELAPGGTLTALVRRALPGVRAVALRGPDDLPAAVELCAEHGAELAAEAPSWQVVVASGRGIVNRASARRGDVLVAGDTVAAIRGRGDDVDVRTARGGRLVEWLVQDGDPVSDGQPLARLVAEAVT
jgi:[acyl-carrier-protein] S-malonyltransferase